MEKCTQHLFKVQFYPPPNVVHVCVDDDKGKWNGQVEEEPHVDHLYVGSCWQIFSDLRSCHSLLY